MCLRKEICLMTPQEILDDHYKVETGLPDNLYHEVFRKLRQHDAGQDVCLLNSIHTKILKRELCRRRPSEKNKTQFSAWRAQYVCVITRSMHDLIEAETFKIGTFGERSEWADELQEDLTPGEPLWMDLSRRDMVFETKLREALLCLIVFADLRQLPILRKKIEQRLRPPQKLLLLVSVRNNNGTVPKFLRKESNPKPRCGGGIP